jgi:hypothetical protein
VPPKLIEGLSLKAVLDPKPFCKEVAYTKIRQFAAEAQAYEISDMRGIRNDAKRYTSINLGGTYESISK